MKTKCCACGKEFALLDAPFYIRQGSHPLCVDCFKRILPSGSLQAMLISKNADPRAFAKEYISTHEAIDQSGFAENIITGLQRDLDQAVEDYYNGHPGFKEAVENSPAFTGEAELICYCPECGTEGRPGIKFCENCGHPLEKVLIRNSDSGGTSSVVISRTDKSSESSVPLESTPGLILSILGLVSLFLSLFMPLAILRYYSMIRIYLSDVFKEYFTFGYIWTFFGLLICFVGCISKDSTWTITGAIDMGVLVLYTAMYAVYGNIRPYVSLDAGFYMHLSGSLLMLVGGLLMPAVQNKNVQQVKWNSSIN